MNFYFQRNCVHQSQKSITQIDLTTNWRFWTEWGSQVSFLDERVGEMKFEIGRDFSDFWFGEKKELRLMNLQRWLTTI